MSHPARLVLCKPSMLLFAALALSSGCARSYDETIAGVSVPVPKAMTRGTEKPVEMSLLGFGAGQAIFRGDMDADEIVEFYKKELPSRGWHTNMNVRGGGAVLAYTKEGNTLLIGVGKQSGATGLTLTVGGAAR